MIKLEPQNKKALLKTALGLEPADLAINNAVWSMYLQGRFIRLSYM